MNAIDWAAEGYPELADAMRKDTARSKAFGNRRTDYIHYAAEQVAAEVVKPCRVLIGVGTPWAAERRADAVAHHVTYRKDGNALHVGPGGHPYEPPRAEVHVGVITPTMPRMVFELSRDYPLAEILTSIPVDSDPPPACDMPASVSIVGGGSSLCTGDASGYAIDFALPWIIAYRTCVKCARSIFEDRWERREWAELSEHNARYVGEAEAAHTRAVMRQHRNGGR